jgi:hypothetical protein
MVKTPCIILSLVVAVCMFVAATDVMAQTTSVPQTCTAGPYTISADPDYFDAVVYGINDPLFALFPCYTSTGDPCAFPYWVFQYDVSPTSNISGIDQVLGLCDDPIQVFAASPNASQLLAPGVGDSGSKWPGDGMYASVVLKWAANPSAGKMWIATNSHTVALTSMALKSGSKMYYCANPSYNPSQPVSPANLPGGIAGPGCEICNTSSAFQADMRVEVFTVENTLIEVTFDANTCEATLVRYSTNNGANWTEATSTGPPTINGEPIQVCGPLEGNQRCPRCLINSGTASCFSIQLGGTWYRIGLSC